MLREAGRVYNLDSTHKAIAIDIAAGDFVDHNFTSPESALMKVLKRSVETSFPNRFLSAARNVKHPRSRSPGGGYAYSLFFPPTKPDFVGLPATFPPSMADTPGKRASASTSATSTGLAAATPSCKPTTSAYPASAQNTPTSSIRSWISPTPPARSTILPQGLIDRKRIGTTGLSAGGIREHAGSGRLRRHLRRERRIRHAGHARRDA